MRPYVFVDLDDSLFQTVEKSPPGEVLEPVAWSADGTALSFMTKKQRAFFEWLDAHSTIIPATGRSFPAFRRVRLPFRSWAILNFGGTLVNDSGQLDLSWDAIVRPEIGPLRPTLYDLAEEVRRQVQPFTEDVSIRVIEDFGLALYVVVKHRRRDTAALRLMHDQHVKPVVVRDDRFGIHLNGNNLSIVPRSIAKARAVRYLIEERLTPGLSDGVVMTLGLGDSLTDADFLAACDLALIPRGSQLFNATLGRSHL